PETPGAIEQVPELERPVARHARNGSPPRAVVREERVDDLAPELLLQVEHVERDSQTVRDETRGAQIAGGAAAPVQRPAGAAAIVELHREAAQVLARLAQEQGGHRRIDAAAHRHDRAGGRAHPIVSSSAVFSVTISIMRVPPTRNSARLSISLCDTFTSFTNTPLVLPRSFRTTRLPCTSMAACWRDTSPSFSTTSASPRPRIVRGRSIMKIRPLSF